MTTPIKPPGTGAPQAPIEEPKSGASKSASNVDAFRQTLDTRPPDPSHEARGVVSSDAIDQLADQVRAGKLDASEVIDRLVARALDSKPATLLTPAGRTQLEATLREALSSDPAIAALLDRATRER